MGAQTVDKFPKPDDRIRLAYKQHGLGVDLFQSQEWGGLKKGFRYLLFLEFEFTATPTDTTTPIVCPPDVLMKIIKNIEVTIPGFQKLEKAFTGEQWAILHKLRGMLGEVFPNFSPNADLLLTDGTAQDGILRIPLYVPDPFAPLSEQCGLYAGHLNSDCVISVQTEDALTALDMGTSVGFDALSGSWSVWAYGYRTKKMTVAPLQIFDYNPVTTQGKQFFQKSNAVRLLASYGKTEDDLVYPSGNLDVTLRDNFLIDSVSPFDVNDDNLGVAMQKIQFMRDARFDPKIKNFATTGILAGTPCLPGINPTAYPTYKYDGSLAAIAWIDNDNTLSVAPYPKNSIQLTPQSNILVYIERQEYPTQTRLNQIAAACGIASSQWYKVNENETTRWKGDGDDWIGPMRVSA